MHDHDQELDAMAEELSAMGVSNADAWADDQREDDEEEPFAVWPENADAFNVFCRCTWQRDTVSDGRGSRLVPTGIAAGEVRDVADLLGIDRSRWPRLLDDVRLMVGTVLPELQRL